MEPQNQVLMLDYRFILADDSSEFILEMTLNAEYLRGP